MADNDRFVPIGTNVISLNHWMGFRTDVFKDQFRTVYFAEIVDYLAEGDAIYVQVAKYPYGKVYGRTKVAITKIERGVNEDSVIVHFKGGDRVGSEVVMKDKETNIEMAVDENKLATLISSLPNSTVWGFKGK